MQKNSFTYRFLAVITVLAVLGSISLPACLYANMQMVDFCPVASSHYTQNLSMMAGGGDMNMSTQPQMRYWPQKQGMDTMMNCCLNTDSEGNGLFFKGEALALSHAQAKIILPVATFDFTAESQSFDRLHELPPPNLNTPPPPIFLVNSTFLN